jgi:sugar O-acyltransferase (sialic acid O-acetyltransferase NeuD family)
VWSAAAHRHILLLVTPKNKRLLLFGSQEMARLARFYFEQDSAYEVVGFTVDDVHIDSKEIDGLPLVPWSEVQTHFPAGEHEMFVALSYRGLNRLRAEKFAQAKAAGYRLATYVCSKSVTWPDLVIGENCFVLENQTVQPTCCLGDNVYLWSGNHIGHGSVIEDHVYLASHIVISGHCRIGTRSFLGVNATLRDFITIGADCFIAMDASVTQDMAAGSVALGQPAAIHGADDKVARMLKRKYFGI